MKKLKLAVVAIFTLAIVGNVNAQDSENPWAFSLGVNAIDFKIGSIAEDFLGNGDWNVAKNISRFSVEK
ncbi:MAG: OmpA family protein, partial [Flavobacteriaceae bacterium]